MIRKNIGIGQIMTGAAPAGLNDRLFMSTSVTSKVGLPRIATGITSFDFDSCVCLLGIARRNEHGKKQTAL